MSDAQTMDWRTMPAGREMDTLIAERVMGYRIERVVPSWYYGREVMLFYDPTSPLIAYTCDQHSDNAMMYRNGVDDSEGIAPPLPDYSGEDIADAWEVVDVMQRRGFLMDLASRPAGGWTARFTKGLVKAMMWSEGETASLAICRAALMAPPE